MLHTLRRGRVSICTVLITISLAVLGSFPAPSVGSSVRGASDLEGSLADAVARYEALENRVLAIESVSARAERRVRRLATKMLVLDHKARRAAIELYKSGATTAVESLMDHDLAELAETAEYLESSAAFHVSVFQTLAAERGRLEATLDRLDVAHAAAEQARSEMAAIKADLQERIEAARPDPELARQATQIATAPEPSSVSTGPYSADWDAIAQCESGGNWHLDSTYDGGLQFHPLTWLSHGGGEYARYAWQASREEQIAIAEKVLASQGPGAWGSCYQE